MKQKIIRVTTVPISLEKLLEGQLTFMNQFYDVVAVSSEKKKLEFYGHKNQIRTYFVHLSRQITPLQDLKALSKMYNFFRKEKPLIVHTHTPKAGIIGMMAAKLAGVPIRLHTVAGMPLMESSGAKRKILLSVEKLTYSCATKVYPNSTGLKEIILKEHLTGEGKLQVLGKGSSNGIDTSYFDPTMFNGSGNRELKESLGIAQEDFIFIFVGRLVRDKGINELVTAFVELQKKKQNISLLLVGPFEQDLDPLEDAVIHHIDRHSKIFCTGFQSDVRPYFAISDVLVFPSYREGFPNVVLQAGAMMIPSIVSNINGCNEIIKDGENGIIIPVKNKKALMESMLWILDNPELLKSFKRNSRTKITSNYERHLLWEILLEEYKSLERSWKNTINRS